MDKSEFELGGQQNAPKGGGDNDVQVRLTCFLFSDLRT